MSSGPNLVFSLKPNDSGMCEKFQMISMRYDDFVNKDSYSNYYREGPWKLYEWNLGDCGKGLGCLVVNPN